jgi:hypothetical protein
LLPSPRASEWTASSDVIVTVYEPRAVRQTSSPDVGTSPVLPLAASSHEPDRSLAAGRADPDHRARGRVRRRRNDENAGEHKHGETRGEAAVPVTTHAEVGPYAGGAVIVASGVAK